MLTAWDKVRETTLVLPDFESGAALAQVRQRTRQGELVCPTCREALWVHAGDLLVPHFAHRRLSNCPHGRVSEAVLGARRLLYRFFQARIESGKLPAEIVLEPVIGGLPEKVRVDLMLRRAAKPAVNVVVIERGLKPDVRDELRRCLGGPGRLFRPVFLKERLKHPEDELRLFLLDPAQREFRLNSVYDLVPPEHWQGPGSLHFIDPAVAVWTTLRGVQLVHDPQVFGCRRMLASKMDRLLWSEGHAEWVHEGEAEALKTFREAIEAKKRREAEQRRQSEQRVPLAKPVSAVPQSKPTNVKPALAATARHEESAPPTKPTPDSNRSAPAPVVAPEELEPLPAWITGGLVCVGCGQRTAAWQNAAPEQDQCVCRTCFAAGVRLR